MSGNLRTGRLDCARRCDHAHYNADMQHWHLRHVRSLVYAALLLCGMGIIAASAMDAENTTEALVFMRQLVGLWALGFLLVAMLVSPMTAAIPKLPLKTHLILARRAIGVSAFVFAAAHVAAFAVPILRRNWRELYAPGTVWIIGLLLGLSAFTSMALLALTSSDRKVVRLGGKRWKRLHRLTYAILPLVLIHALLLGSDFGLNRAPDVKAERDFGALIGFGLLSAAWLALFLMAGARR